MAKRFDVPWCVSIGLAAVTILASTVLAQRELVDSSALRQAGLARYWEMDLRLMPDETLVGLTLLDENLYATTSLGNVYCLRADAGLIRFSVNVTRSGHHIFHPTHFGESAYFASGREVIALDRRTGLERARWKLDSMVSGPSVADDEQLYVVSHTGRLTAIRMADSLPMWSIVTGEMVSSAPVVADGTIYVASRDKIVQARRTHDKEERWRMGTSGPIFADLVLGDGGLYVASMDRILYCLDPINGAVRWRRRTGGPLPLPPYVCDGVCFVATQDAGVYAMNAGDGTLGWVYPEGAAFLADLGKDVLVFTNSWQLHRLDKAEGHTLGRCPAEQVQLMAPAVGVPAGFVAARDGRVLCIRSADQPYLTRRKLEELTQPEAEPGEETGSGEATDASSTGDQPPANPLASPSESPPLVGRDYQP